MSKEDVYVGIDVSLTHLDVGVWPQGEAWQSPNAPDGYCALTDRVTTLSPTRVVMEATGGIESVAGRGVGSRRDAGGSGQPPAGPRVR